MIPIWPYGVHENCPIFKTLNLLFIYVQNFSPPWPWMFSFKQTSPVQMITNELKQNMIEGRNTNNNMLNTINKVSTELFIIIIHWGDVGKTVVMKVLGNYQESVLSNVCFKQLELSNPSTYNYTKNWLNRKCFLCLSREFSKFLGKRSWWNHFIK